MTPIKARTEDDEITEFLENLVTTLKGNPSPWLRKSLQQKEKSFGDFEEEETNSPQSSDLTNC